MLMIITMMIIIIKCASDVADENSKPAAIRARRNIFFLNQFYDYRTEDCDTDRKIVALGCCYWHCIGSPWLSVKTLLYYYSEMVRQTEGCDTAPKVTCCYYY